MAKIEYVDDRKMGQVWLYVLGILFGIGIMFYLILPALFGRAVPAIYEGFRVANLTDNSTQQQIAGNIEFTKTMVRLALWFVAGSVIMYGGWAIWFKERNDVYYG